MKRRSVLIGALLVIVLLLVGGGITGLAIAGQSAEGPQQPVNFPHTVHVSSLGLECQFCHRGVETQANATIPPVEQCLFCHVVIKTTSPEIQKLTNSFKNNEPIDWQRVHREPDHVGFEHFPHIQAGFDCSTCHGDVTNMGETGHVKQVRSLGMGDCVNCHRQNNAPTDCATCHK